MRSLGKGCVLVVVGLVLFGLAEAAMGQRTSPLIVDHSCTDLTAVPQGALQAAKDELSIAYGHTSHGSQLTSGMTGLVGFINGGGLGLSYPTDFFAWNSSGSGGALRLRDGIPGASDLGNPNRTQWEAATRAFLDDPANSHVNVIIWSWCGQVDGTEAEIQLYLDLMDGLEEDYPNVQFVHMTGHLNGTGAAGNVNIRNQQIRDWCTANNKILYDFADIESYDPDGLVNYMVLNANDAGYYDGGNWAIAWQNSHIEDVDWYDCGCAHCESAPLIANRKAYGAWYLWASLAGWQQEPPCVAAPTGLQAAYDGQTGQVTLTWTDNSSDPNEDRFVIGRRVDEGGWNDSYGSAGSDVTTWQETISVDGTYRYRVVAHLDDNGGGGPCDSLPSNIATIVISTSPPAAPSDLSTTLNGATIQVNWTDNSNNEQAFVLERSVDAGAFAVRDETIGENTTSYSDGPLATGHTYAYRVKARNTHGDSGYSNTDSEYVPSQSFTVMLDVEAEMVDSFLQSGNPDTNYGGSSWCPVDFNRYIVKFNLPAEVEGKHIIHAEMGFYLWSVNYVAGQYMQLYRVTSDWDEMSVTWNQASTGVAWGTAGGDYAELVAQVPVQNIDHAYVTPRTDVTALVQQWVTSEVSNHGLLLVNESPATCNLKASEYSGSNTYLEITYDDSCPYHWSGDFDDDCKVDLEDLAQMCRHWLGSDAGTDIAPGMGDGVVNLVDLAELASQWLFGTN